MKYRYSSFIPTTDLFKEIGDNDFIPILDTILVFNEKRTVVKHIQVITYKDKILKNAARALDMVISEAGNWDILKRKWLTLKDVAEIMNVALDELKEYIDNWEKKKYSKPTEYFDLKRMKNTINSKKNRSAVTLRNIAIKSDLVNYFGSEDKYKEFMEHTLFSSYRVKIIMNPLYEYDTWMNPFDMVSVELPVYPISYHDDHKKELYRYALIRLAYYPDYTKLNIPTRDLKLHSVTWDHEFISFHFVIKE